MFSSSRRHVALLALLTAASLPAAAVAQQHCSQEVLKVRGTPVTIGYCVTGNPRNDGAGEVVVPVAATYSAPAASFGQQRDLRFIAGERNSRILESLNLDRLGMTGVLHLTLLYTGEVVRVEGALLTPGAITIK